MGMLLVVALIAAADPVRLGIVLLLISRPRPMRSLLAYWLGAMGMGIAVAVGLLTLLRYFAPTLAHTVASIAASSTSRHVQLVIGLLALLLAALVAVGFSARRRAGVPVLAGDSRAQVPQPGTAAANSRLLARARGVLDSESEWVAFVAGLGNGPPAVECLIAITAILASRATIGTQIGAAVAFIVVMLAVVEIPLLSYLAMGPQTQAVMLQLHNWVRSRRRQTLAVILAVAGVMLVAAGA